MKYELTCILFHSEMYKVGEVIKDKIKKGIKSEGGEKDKRN